MNSLERYITDNKLDPHEAMMRLRDAGLISDNAAGPDEVAGLDCFIACNHLERDRPKKK